MNSLTTMQHSTELIARSSPALYLYQPSHALPAAFAVLVGISMLLHIYQNFRYRFWRVTFWMFWGATVFTTGWAVRTVSSYYPLNRGLYTAQTVLVYAGPPMFAAAEYNVLARMFYYLPYHAPFHPGRTLIVFVYLGAAAEALVGAGAAYYGTAHGIEDRDLLVRGGTLLSISLALQAVVECVFISLVGLVHYRCVKARKLPRNVRTLCIMLYGTSTFVLIRCIARAIESFSTETTTTCSSICRLVLFHQWYLYVFEAAPMVLYTFWINLVHPGRILPVDKHRYLDPDGVTERIGPLWIDSRTSWQRVMDPLDAGGALRGKPAREAFWLQSQNWQTAPGGSFALGTATNVNGGTMNNPKKRSASVFRRTSKA